MPSKRSHVFVYGRAYIPYVLNLVESSIAYFFNETIIIGFLGLSKVVIYMELKKKASVLRACHGFLVLYATKNV